MKARSEDAPSARRPRVLVIPSWYPTRRNAVTGSVFREQCNLLADAVDVRVLFGRAEPVSPRGALTHTVRSLAGGRAALRPLGRRWAAVAGLRATNWEPCDLALEPPPATGFRYLHGPTGETGRLRAERRAYEAALRRVMAQGWRPDLVHALSTANAGIVGHHLARVFGWPLVISEHNLFALSMHSPACQRMMMEALKAADRVIAVSRHQMRCLFMHGLDRDVDLVWNLIDESVFAPAPPPPASARFTILTVTYPAWIKDCGTFFRAVAAMAAQGHGDVEALVAGSGAFEDARQADVTAFERLAREHGVAGQCRFLPHVPRSEMPRIHARAHVFVSSSLAETFGLALREAMAVGRPVVSTCNGGADDIVGPDNGILVPLRDPAAMAAALIAIKTGRVRFDPARVRRTVVETSGREAFRGRMTGLFGEVLAAARSRSVPRD